MNYLMNCFWNFIIVICLLFLTSFAVNAQDVAAAPAIVDYWPYALAVLLAISELLAFSPLKANGIVQFFVLILKSLAGKK